MISDLPPYRIDTCVADAREPGMMVFNVRPGGRADLTGNVGWILGVDQAGDIVLNLQFDHPTQDVRAHPNGNIVFSRTSEGVIEEVTRAGVSVRQWHIEGKWRDKTPPKDSVAIPAALTHHTINVLPNGNLLLLSAEMRTLPNWPGSDTNPDAPRETANVVGDVVLEVAPNGTIANQWRFLDMFDPYRICYGSRSGYWKARGFPDSYDWCHTNAINYSTADDGIIASLRTQDCIVKFSRATGDLKWILGTHDNWKSPWADKLLTPDASVNWQYHQHDCSVTPQGTILCFDNGNHKATPFQPKTPAVENYSRVVEFAVDEATMSARQVWAFGEADHEKMFACYQGGAYRLPQTGNTFMTYGGICTLDGESTEDVENGFARARLIEVTPRNEIVFDMWIDASGESDARSLSSFRSEHIPPT